jgi:hypothetical protein
MSIRKKTISRFSFAILSGVWHDLPRGSGADAARDSVAIPTEVAAAFSPANGCVPEQGPGCQGCDARFARLEFRVYAVGLEYLELCLASAGFPALTGNWKPCHPGLRSGATTVNCCPTTESLPPRRACPRPGSGAGGTETTAKSNSDTDFTDFPIPAFGRNQDLLARRRGGTEIKRQEQSCPPCVPAPLRET